MWFRRFFLYDRKLRPIIQKRSAKVQSASGACYAPTAVERRSALGAGEDGCRSNRASARECARAHSFLYRRTIPKSGRFDISSSAINVPHHFSFFSIKKAMFFLYIAEHWSIIKSVFSCLKAIIRKSAKQMKVCDAKL